MCTHTQNNISPISHLLNELKRVNKWEQLDQRAVGQPRKVTKLVLGFLSCKRLLVWHSQVCPRNCSWPKADRGNHSEKPSKVTATSLTAAGNLGAGQTAFCTYSAFASYVAWPEWSWLTCRAEQKLTLVSYYVRWWGCLCFFRKFPSHWSKSLFLDESVFPLHTALR